MEEMLKQIVKKFGTPTFIYDENELTQNIERIQTAILNSKIKNPVQIFIPYFTNSNPHIFQITTSKKTGIVLQSIEEWYQLKRFKLNQKQIIVSPGVLPRTDLDFFIKKDLLINCATKKDFEYVITKTNNVGLRIDISRNQKSRLGVKINELKTINKASLYKIKQIHVYAGTNSSLKKLIKTMQKTLKIHKQFFPHVKEINLGGGFEYNYIKSEHYCWQKYFAEIKKTIEKYQLSTDIKLIIEPGRDVLTSAGKLLLSITQSKQGRISEIYTDGSYTIIPSATIRKRIHRTDFFDSNFKKMKLDKNKARLNGCTTLSSDYIFPETIFAPNLLERANYILINDIGAYGSTQHLEFLNKRPATEVIITKNRTLKIIAQRGNFEDKIRNTIVE